MFKNTREIIAKTAKDVKLLISLPGKLEPFILLFSIIYQTYMFITDKALAYVHLALLILVVANFLFKAIVGNIYDSREDHIFSKPSQRKKTVKRTLKIEKKIYNIIKYAIRLFLIVASVVSIVREPSIIKIVATMIIFTELIIEVAIFIIGNIVEYKWVQLQTAFNEDLATFSEPIKIVKSKAQKVKDTVVDIFGGFFRRKSKAAYKTLEASCIDPEENAALPSGEEETV